MSNVNLAGTRKKGPYGFPVYGTSNAHAFCLKDSSTCLRTATTGETQPLLFAFVISTVFLCSGSIFIAIPAVFVWQLFSVILFGYFSSLTSIRGLLS